MAGIETELTPVKICDLRSKDEPYLRALFLSGMGHELDIAGLRRDNYHRREYLDNWIAAHHGQAHTADITDMRKGDNGITQVAGQVKVAYLGHTHRLIGLAAATTPPDGQGYTELSGDYVYGDVRREGIGGRLADAVLGEVDQSLPVRARILPGNMPAAQLLVSRGFKRLPEMVEIEIGGYALAAIIMERPSQTTILASERGTA